MEFRVEAEEGCAMPEGCYIGVRVGEVLKQGKYEPSRCYHFPQLERRRHAKIDIFRHVGSCQFSVDQEGDKVHHVQVEGKDLDKALRLQVHAQARLDDKGKAQREARTKVLKNQAMDYLSKHGIEERLSDVVKALLKEQPPNPTEFICNRLRGDMSALEKAQQPPPAPANKAAPSQQSAGASKDLAAVRKQACDVLLAASADGELVKVLAEVKTEQQQQDQQQKQKDLASVRQQACDVLISASTSGQLSQVLSEVKHEQKLADVKAQAKSVLLEASSNGNLIKVLAEVKAETTVPIRSLQATAQIVDGLSRAAAGAGAVNPAAAAALARAAAAAAKDWGEQAGVVKANSATPPDGLAQAAIACAALKHPAALGLAKAAAGAARYNVLKVL